MSHGSDIIWIRLARLFETSTVQSSQVHISVGVWALYPLSLPPSKLLDGNQLRGQTMPSDSSHFPQTRLHKLLLHGTLFNNLRSPSSLTMVTSSTTRDWSFQLFHLKRIITGDCCRRVLTECQLCLGYVLQKSFTPDQHRGNKSNDYCLFRCVYVCRESSFM